jgi:hypothetical protein
MVGAGALWLVSLAAGGYSAGEAEEARRQEGAYLPLVVKPGTPPPQIGGCDVFPADHIWNTRVDSLPVHPNSETYIATIGEDIGLHPDFGRCLAAGFEQPDRHPVRRGACRPAGAGGFHLVAGRERSGAVPAAAQCAYRGGQTRTATGT